MNFGEQKAAFIALADDPSITPGNAGIWLNVNYKLLLRERPWPFMQSAGSFIVTSGTSEYTLSALSTPVTDFGRLVKVFKGDTANSYQPINVIRYEDRNLVGVANSVYVTPSLLKMGVVPTPTNSADQYNFEYEKTVADMSNDSDTPVDGFIADFHFAIVYKALMMYQFQQREQSDEFRAQYNEILVKMLDFYVLPSLTSVPLMTRGFTNIKRDSSSPLVP
jgi:hypothetical protein